MPAKSIALSERVRFDIHVHEKEDRYISRSILDYGIWAPGETEHAMSHVGPGDVFVDIGANIGWFTLVAASLGASVIAFEPDPENYEILARNTAGMASVKTYQIALSNARGTASLYKSGFNLGDHRLFGDGARDSIQVQTDTFSNLIDFDVDFIKSDTQGHEAKVLDGMSGYFASSRKRPKLMFELWPNGLNATGSSVAELVRILSSFGYPTDSIAPESQRLDSQFDFEAHTTIVIG